MEYIFYKFLWVVWNLNQGPLDPKIPTQAFYQLSSVQISNQSQNFPKGCYAIHLIHMISTREMEFSYISDGVKTAEFVFQWEEMKKYVGKTVVLIASVKRHTREFDLDFTAPSGYILIQTDKPVYTPGQTGELCLPKQGWSDNSYIKWQRYNNHS